MLGSYRVMHVVEEKERGRPNRRGLERSSIRSTEMSKAPEILVYKPENLKALVSAKGIKASLSEAQSRDTD
jgi:hypothetical protein